MSCRLRRRITFLAPSLINKHCIMSPCPAVFAPSIPIFCIFSSTSLLSGRKEGIDKSIGRWPVTEHLNKWEGDDRNQYSPPQGVRPCDTTGRGCLWLVTHFLERGMTPPITHRSWLSKRHNYGIINAGITAYGVNYREFIPTMFTKLRK